MQQFLIRAVSAAWLGLACGLINQQPSFAQTTSSETVPIPAVDFSHSYTDDDPPGDEFVFVGEEFITGIPQFDPSQGSLTGVGISASFDLDFDLFLDTNGILATGSPHEAYAEGYFEVGISFGLGNTFHSIATEFFDWGLSCTGEPTDMDGCQDSAGGSTSVDVIGSIDGGFFESFIGEGNIEPGNLHAFILVPQNATFELDNVGGAGVDFSAALRNGQITVQYSSNDGSSPEAPLLPPPPGTLPSAFDAVDCQANFCIIGTIGNNEIGIRRPLFFDPPPAIGFDYKVVTGPNVAGIQIPAGFGDDLFELLVSTDGVNYQPFGPISADILYDLTVQFPGGVSHLRLLGIEPDAGVDSEDPQGFPTGLTFISGGSTQVGIVMTPISVPEPATALLGMGAGCFGMTLLRRRR